jgi:hypothetical protein
MHRRLEKRGTIIPREILLAVSTSVLLMSSAALAADKACTPGGQSVNLPLRKADPVSNGYSVTILVGDGKAHGVQVDTGSSRIMVPRSAVSDTLWQKFEKPSHILYSSNGGYNFGKIVKTPVKLGVSSDATGGCTTGNLDVLVVTCHCSVSAGLPPVKPYPNAVPPQCSDLNGAAPDTDGKGTSSLADCVDAISSVGMMGVGFGRGGNPMDNAFLRLTDMDNGTMHRGYIIGEDRIELGLTEKNTEGFQFVQLNPHSSLRSNEAGPSAKPAAPALGVSPPKDWLEPDGCVELKPAAEKSARFCGKLLMDTGITEMLLSVPAAQRPSSCVVPKQLKKGTDLRVPDTIPMELVIAGPEAPVLAYSFKPGGPPPAPSYVSWRGAQAASVGGINTGRHLLAKARYLYDADGGRMGFNPKHSTAVQPQASQKQKAQADK